MANDAARAAFWRDFVIARCGYPDAARLAEQFDGAELADFCACGCNSFGVRVRPGTPPLARETRSGGIVFNADFAVTADRQLEIMLSVDAAGHLDRVDVSCNANSHPVPHAIPIDLEPFHIWSSDKLIA